MTWSLGAGKCRLQAAQEAEFSACCRWNSRVWGEAEPGDVGVTTLLSFSRGQERDVWHSHGYLAADSVEESEIWEVNCSRCNCLIAAAGGLVSEAVKKSMVQLAFCWILSFPASVSQPWVCWWTLATMSILCSQALPMSLECSWVMTHSPNSLEIRKSSL